MFLCIVLVGVIMIIVPFSLGVLYLRMNGDEGWLDKGMVAAFVYGYLFMWAIFQCVCVPLALLDVSLNTLIGVYLCVLIGVSLLMYMRGRANKFIVVRESSSQKERLLGITLLIIIVFQIVMLVVFQHSNADDSEFVAISTTAVQTNTLYHYDPYTGQEWEQVYAKRLVAPFSLIIAVYSKLTMIHPAIFSHTVLPAFLILFSYFAYFLIAKKLFPMRVTSQLLFVILIAVLMMFGGYSTRAIGSMLLIRIWQGKAVFASTMLPIIFALILGVLGKKMNGKQWGLLCIAVLASTLTTAMADVLLPVFVCGFAVAQWWCTKEINEGFKLMTTTWPCIVLGLLSMVV